MIDSLILITANAGDEIVFVYAPFANVLQAIILFFKKISRLFSK